MNPVVLKKVNDIVDKEIKNLSRFYTYKIKDFKDPELLHARSMLVFMDPEMKLPGMLPGRISSRLPDEQRADFINRVINLMAGIELLAIGLNLHTFDVDDFMMLLNMNNSSSKSKSPIKTMKNPTEKNYTVQLLFGDVFYSRAVIYILEYRDFHIFNSILDSLKSAHRSRLILHQGLVGGLNSANIGTRMIALLEDNERVITGINSLLKTSFFIGWGVFSDPGRIRLPYEIVNEFLLLKTLNDIGSFFDGILKQYASAGKREDLSVDRKPMNEKSWLFIDEKTRTIKDSLASKIKNLEPYYVKDNFHSLQDLY